MPKPRTVNTISAGGVVFRRLNDTVQILLVGQSDRDLWGLPKGGPRRGETIEETALREVSEETGLVTRLVCPLEAIQYWFAGKGVRFRKTVYFFLLEETGGDLAYHDTEHDVVEWFDSGEALNRITYDSERDLVRRALAVLDDMSQTAPQSG